MLDHGVKGVINLDLKYSVDKIKLEFQYVKTGRVQDFLNRFSYSNNSDKYYMSNSLTACKHNFLFGEEDGKVYLGIEPNWKPSSKDDKSIILEFNPNKVNPFLYSDLIWLRSYPRVLVRVCSFDIAVDMLVDYNSLRMLKRDTRESWCKIGKRYTETQYLGQMGHNHVKLYNKAVEQKIKDFHWSRFEITVKEINSLSCSLKEFRDSINLPQVYLLQEQSSIDDLRMNPVQRLALEQIITDINLLYTITDYKTRKKYEKLLYSHLTSVDISIEKMYKAYIDYTSNFDGDNQNLKDVDTELILSMNSMI